MTVRQTFFGVGFVAALASAFFALMPARTTVQVSALPDFPGLDVVLRVGGSLGLSLSADEQSIRVECGSPAVRKKFDAENHNVIQEIFESAQRLLKAIRNACDAVVDPRRNAALGLGGGSAILLLAAAVAGGRSRAAAPRTRQVVGSPAAPPGWYPGPGGTSGHLWWDGSAWHAAVAPRPVLPTKVPDRSVARAAGQFVSRHRLLVPLGLVTLIAVPVAIAAGISRDSSNSVTFGLPGNVDAATTTEDPEAELRRACIENAVSSADQGFDAAVQRSSEDEKNARINLDGDSSFVEYASQLQTTDLFSCPQDFRSAFQDFVDAWRAYGEGLKSATEGVFPDHLSQSDVADFALRINQARSNVQSVAADHEAEVPRITYTLG